MSEEGARWYKGVNQRLLRIQRVGSPFVNVSFRSLEELRNTLLPPGSNPKVIYRVETDCSITEVEDDKEFYQTEAFLAAARKLPPEEERKVLLKEIFERARRHDYEEENELETDAGRPPWYIMTAEEIEMVGLELPYSLVTHPDREFIQDYIKEEGQRLKSLRAAGLKATPWSTWNKGKRTEGCTSL